MWNDDPELRRIYGEGFTKIYNEIVADSKMTSAQKKEKAKQIAAEGRKLGLEMVAKSKANKNK